MKFITLLFTCEPMLTLALAVLFFVKFLLFVKARTERWSWANFVYFKEKHIVSSSTMQTQTAKKVQNYLSNLIVLIALLQLSATLLEKVILNA